MTLEKVAIYTASRKQTRQRSNDKTIIELSYRKRSRFVSVLQINYLPQPNMANEISLLNLEIFLQHLKDASHIPQQNTEESVQSLLKTCARRNKESHPDLKPVTCFLTPKTTPDGKVYWVYEKDKLLHLLKQTVRFGRKRLNKKGRIEAVYRFNTCVGIYCVFKNVRDKTNGFKITELYSVKVVYNQDDDNSIIGITSFPDYFEH